MSSSPPQRYQPPDPGQVDPHRLEGRFTQRLGELRRRLANSDPVAIAMNTGAAFMPGSPKGSLDSWLQLPYWSRLVTITCSEWVAYPDGGDQPLSDFDQALLLYYLTTADGAPLAGEWIAFSGLPDGRFYNQAFQGYTGAELARLFKDDIAGFERAAQALGGLPQPLGEAAFAFQALPRAPLLVVYWQGDEDFPSTCQVLFDASASHYLPTDAYAILGSTLTRKLIKARS